MSMQPERQAMSTQEIVFSNGNQAHVVFLPSGAHIHDLPSLLHIPPFHELIMIVGGAGLMEGNLYPKLARLFTHGVAHLAATRNALVIDGGTQAGVMELMGTGIAEQQHRSPLLGVSPAGRVSYPEQSASATNEERAPLDPNHSHFVLVETDEWGGETATMYELAHIFAKERPSVAIVINGGAIAIKEVLYNVRQKRPILVLEGSGRAADNIAQLWQEKPSAISDPDLAEIIQHGDIHLFPITSSAEVLVQLIQQLLNQD
ncbi:MAG: hypothetical protein NVS4B11_08180 [Ktedonobacteraceae bacterium]